MKSQEFLLEGIVDGSIGIYLEKNGYKFLGSGVDQEAYLEPSTGQVLKIFGYKASYYANAGLSDGQEMAIFWINYCKKNANNPFLPKFFGWEKFIWEGNDYLQIRMERLGQFPKFWSTILAQLSEFVAEGDYDVDNAMDVLTNYYGEGELSEYHDSVVELFMSIGENGLRVLYKTLNDLYYIAQQKGWVFDLHRNNFLIRNDGTPVIVDPWVAK